MPKSKQGGVANERQAELVRKVRAGRHFGALLLSQEAKRNGWKTTWVNNHIGIVHRGDTRLLIDGYFVTESTLGLKVCSDKAATKKFLDKSNISTPMSLEVMTEGQATDAWRRLRSPVVIKPSRGRKGNGVSVNISSESGVVEAFNRAAKVAPRVLIEEYIDAEAELRIMASESDSLVINRRLTAHVVGDGISTVVELVRQANKKRRNNPSLYGRSILIDDATQSFLARQGHSLDDVPSSGAVIYVSDSAGLSRGGETFQYFEEADEDLRGIGPAAIEAIPGLNWGGVDVILERYTGKPYVIEVNAGAGGYGAALFPSRGSARDVIGRVWDLRQGSVGVEGAPPEIQLSYPVQGSALRDGYPHLFERSNRPTLAELAFHTFRQMGGRVHKFSRGLFELTLNGRCHLLAEDLMTASDRCVATRSARRHGAALRILAQQGVPLVQGQMVDNAQEAREFATQHMDTIALTPTQSQWAGPRTSFVDSESNDLAYLNELPRRYVVQERPPGTRVRVLAGRTRVFALFFGGHDFDVGEVVLNSICRVAVEAVRAIPELRWAAVDVVMHSDTQGVNTEKGAFVEGMSLTPKFNATDYVFIDDIEQFAHMLLASPGSDP